MQRISRSTVQECQPQKQSLRAMPHLQQCSKHDQAAQHCNAHSSRRLKDHKTNAAQEEGGACHQKKGWCCPGNTPPSPPLEQQRGDTHECAGHNACPHCYFAHESLCTTGCCKPDIAESSKDVSQDDDSRPCFASACIASVLMTCHWSISRLSACVIERDTTFSIHSSRFCFSVLPELYEQKCYY